MLLRAGGGQCCWEVWQVSQNNQKLQRSDGAALSVVSHQGIPCVSAASHQSYVTTFPAPQPVRQPSISRLPTGAVQDTRPPSDLHLPHRPRQAEVGGEGEVPGQGDQDHQLLCRHRAWLPRLPDLARAWLSPAARLRQPQVGRAAGSQAVQEVPLPPQPQAGLQPRQRRPQGGAEHVQGRGECDHRGVRGGRDCGLGPGVPR